MTRLWTIVAASAASLLASSPAYSRFVVIDGNTLTGFTPCTYGGSSCQAFSTTSAAGSINQTPASGSSTINFTMSYGNGPQSNIYVYNNGLIAIGSQLTGAVTTINSLAALGQDVLSPIYDAGVQFTDFQYASGIVNGGPFFGQQFLRINFFAYNNGDPTPVQVNIYQNGNAGDFVVLFAYGDTGFLPTLPDSGLIGYYLASNLQQTTAGASAADFEQPLNDNVFRYAFVNGAPVGNGAVPEPSTWLQMLLGFGMLGFGVRRLRGRVSFGSAQPAT